MIEQKSDQLLPDTLGMKINKVFIEIEYFIRIIAILSVIGLDIFFCYIANQPYNFNLYSVDLITLIGFTVMIVIIIVELIFHWKTIDKFADQSYAYAPTLVIMGICIVLSLFTYFVMVGNYFS